MRLFHIHEAEGSTYHVRTALGVDSDRWNHMHGEIYCWRLELAGLYGIPTDRYLSARDLILGCEPHAGNSEEQGLTPEQAKSVFLSGLRLIENVARSVGGVEIINACFNKEDLKGYRWVSLDRLLNRINSSVGEAGRQAFLIFSGHGEEMVSRAYRRLRTFNPVPSRYRLWEEGERTRNMPVENIIGGPAFRSSHTDLLLQMSGFVAFALLSREEGAASGEDGLGLGEAFSILNRALNRRASLRDPQGIVRR